MKTTFIIAAVSASAVNFDGALAAFGGQESPSFKMTQSAAALQSVSSRFISFVEDGSWDGMVQVKPLGQLVEAVAGFAEATNKLLEQCEKEGSKPVATIPGSRFKPANSVITTKHVVNPVGEMRNSMLTYQQRMTVLLRKGKDAVDAFSSHASLPLLTSRISDFRHSVKAMNETVQLSSFVINCLGGTSLLMSDCAFYKDGGSSSLSSTWKVVSARLSSTTKYLESGLDSLARSLPVLVDLWSGKIQPQSREDINLSGRLFVSANYFNIAELRAASAGSYLRNLNKSIQRKISGESTHSERRGHTRGGRKQHHHNHHHYQQAPKQEHFEDDDDGMIFEGNSLVDEAVEGFEENAEGQEEDMMDHEVMQTMEVDDETLDDVTAEVQTKDGDDQTRESLFSNDDD